MEKRYEQSLKKILEEMVDSFQLKPKLHQQKLQQSWAKIMGTTISQYTRALMLRKRILYITIESAPLRQELSYSKEKIKMVLNEELGEEYILDVIVK